METAFDFFDDFDVADFFLVLVLFDFDFDLDVDLEVSISKSKSESSSERSSMTKSSSQSSSDIIEYVSVSGMVVAINYLGKFSASSVLQCFVLRILFFVRY